MALKLSEKEIDELSKSIAQAYVSRNDIQKAETKIFIDTYMSIYEAARSRLKVHYAPQKMEWDETASLPSKTL